MHPDRVRAVSLSIAEVTSQTRWIFVEVCTAAGLCGVGEATLAGHEEEVARAAKSLAPTMLALPDGRPVTLLRRLPDRLPEAAVLSALDQALWDIAAQRDGVRLAEALGHVQRDRIPVYANINRRTRDRSPAGFADSARAAIAAGHVAVKLAPFDEAAVGDSIEALAPGLARMAAVRDAVGQDVELLVDCHWRLSPATSNHVIAAAAELTVSWIECPLPETIDTINAIVRIRKEANRRGITLAGLESAIGVAGFRPFIRAGAYDVMMPDVKYVGGLAEMHRLAKELQAAGIGLSPHNPSGPVSHAVSLHFCASVGSLLRLETQFDETPLFDALIDHPLGSIDKGTMAVPAGTGTGVRLVREALRRYRILHWTTQSQEDGTDPERECPNGRNQRPATYR